MFDLESSQLKKLLTYLNSADLHRYFEKLTRAYRREGEPHRKTTLYNHSVMVRDYLLGEAIKATSYGFFGHPAKPVRQESETFRSYFWRKTYWAYLKYGFPFSVFLMGDGVWLALATDVAKNNPMWGGVWGRVATFFTMYTVSRSAFLVGFYSDIGRAQVSGQGFPREEGLEAAPSLALTLNRSAAYGIYNLKGMHKLRLLSRLSPPGVPFVGPRPSKGCLRSLRRIIKADAARRDQLPDSK